MYRLNRACWLVLIFPNSHAWPNFTLTLMQPIPLEEVTKSDRGIKFFIFFNVKLYKNYSRNVERKKKMIDRVWG